MPMLARGDVDVVIAQDWFNAPLSMPDGVSRLDLFDDIADLALPVGHRLAGRGRVTLDDLRGEAWITWPSGTICRGWLMHTYRSMGVEPLIAHTAAEHATQLALVAAGLGPAVIPRLGRGEVPPGACIVEVEPTLRRHVFVAWRTNSARHSNVLAVRAAGDHRGARAGDPPRRHAVVLRRSSLARGRPTGRHTADRSGRAERSPLSGHLEGGKVGGAELGGQFEELHPAAGIE